jgi:hypothetical protein
MLPCDADGNKHNTLGKLLDATRCYNERRPIDLENHSLQAACTLKPNVASVHVHMAPQENIAKEVKEPFGFGCLGSQLPLTL